jgi:hypothetical protein
LTRIPPEVRPPISALCGVEIGRSALLGTAVRFADGEDFVPLFPAETLLRLRELADPAIEWLRRQALDQPDWVNWLEAGHQASSSDSA